jgi:hypothetical protein
MAVENEKVGSATVEERESLERMERNRRQRLDLYSMLEFRLGIPNGFIYSLDKELDDWSYIVKLAVLCEAAVTHALVSMMKDDENGPIWYDHFSSLTNARRLQLAHSLGVLPKSVKDQLDAIAQFRNSFAHQVGNLGGSLANFFAQCSVDRKRDLANKLLNIQHKNDQDWGFYIANTRLLIAVGAVTAIKALAVIGLAQEDIVALEEYWRVAKIEVGGPNAEERAVAAPPVE